MKEMILEYIKNEYIDDDEADEVQLDENTPLISSGIVDSFSMVSLKRFLEKKGVPYEEIDVEAKDDLRLWLAETTGQKTVPQIFAGDRPLGGFSDIDALDREGRLDPILRGEP